MYNADMKKHKQKWFKKIRGSYIPRTQEGWLLYIPYTLLLGLVYWYVMRNFGYTISAVIVIAAGWILVASGMTYIASKLS